jgi:hypothetical protein
MATCFEHREQFEFLVLVRVLAVERCPVARSGLAAGGFGGEEGAHTRLSNGGHDPCGLDNESALLAVTRLAPGPFGVNR